MKKQQQKIEPTNFLKIRPYTISDLAKIYGVHKDTFRSWLLPFSLELGQRQGHYYNIRQVQVIIERIGLPSEIPLD